MEPRSKDKIILQKTELFQNKRCGVCGIIKPLDMFPPRLNKSTNPKLIYKTTYNQCRACTSERKKLQRERRKFKNNAKRNT